ncbi:MAG: glycoside hydrolase family 43 protein [bacterium]|nr:glycoside hydrolase family 43 protein [bacterium]
MLKREEIQIRDPYVLVHDGMYYLYGTTDKNCWSDKGTGFDSYRSSDLENWEGPFTAFRPDKDFWGDRHFWAPEVYYYEGKFYMFASFKSAEHCRATQVLVSDAPDGEFRLHSEKPLTPEGWECLDGTLWIEDGEPWMVFCHEWIQVIDGEMWAVRLKKDLSGTIGDPVLLFKSSQAPWTVGAKQRVNGEDCLAYVTDGPNLYRTEDGGLLMLWSCGGKKGYAIGMAKSSNGRIDGDWTHLDKLLFEENGGHGMIFTALDGKKYVALHKPNKTPNERPCFFEVAERAGILELNV